jgi:hypothetical protein
VLYSRRQNLWKLADFGLSTEATSKGARPTLFAKGTTSYRAPELLKEEPTFTNKVDIWALGCVIHELATGKSAFLADWAVQQYSFERSPIAIEFPWLPKFLQHSVSVNINGLLNRDWKGRPSATNVCLSFLSFCQYLDISVAQKLVIPTYPSYVEWKERVKEVRSAGVNENVTKGLEVNFNALALKETANAGQFEDVESEDYSSGVRTPEGAIEEEATNFWLWFNGNIAAPRHLTADDVDATTMSIEASDLPSPKEYEDSSLEKTEAVTDIAAPKKKGNTALFWAVKSENEKLVRMLLASGGDMTYQDEDGNTALHWGVKQGLDKIVQMMLEAGANMSFKDSGGNTPLHWAVKQGLTSIVELLVGSGADMTAQDNDGYTPVHWAVKHGYDHIVKIFVDAGADLTPEDTGGTTALGWAVKHGYDDIVEMLLKAGAV